MFNRFKLFKINVLKAMFDAEQNQQQKDLLKAVMVDEFASDPDLLAIQEGIRKKEALKTLGLPEDINLAALTGKVQEDAVEVKAEKESEEPASQEDSAGDDAEVSEDAEPVNADGVKLVQFHQEEKEESEEPDSEEQKEEQPEKEKTPA